MASPVLRSVNFATPGKGARTVVTDTATAANDTVYVFQCMNWTDTTDFTTPTAPGISNWQPIQKFKGSGTQIAFAIWQGTVQTAGQKTITIPLPASNNGINYGGVLTCNGQHTMDGTSIATASTKSVANLAVGPINETQADSVMFMLAGIVDYSGSSSAHLGTPAGMTKYTSPYSSDKEQETALYLQTLSASGSTGTRTLVPNVGYTDGTGAVMFGLTKTAAAVNYPPSVDAGADVLSQTIGTPLARTATESANGSAITARSWKIISGPAGAGTTIGTAAALNWTPNTLGTYVLRYSATNAIGTSTDDMNVTVTQVAVDPGSPLVPPAPPAPTGTTSAWSNEVHGSIRLSGAWIHVPGQEANGFVLPYGGVGRQHALDQAKTALQFVGRKYPVYDVGEARAESLQINSSIIAEDGDVEARANRIRDLGRNSALVLFRDGRGRKMYAMPSDVSLTDTELGGYEVSFLLNRVDYDESLPGVT